MGYPPAQLGSLRLWATTETVRQRCTRHSVVRQQGGVPIEVDGILQVGGELIDHLGRVPSATHDRYDGCLGQGALGLHCAPLSPNRIALPRGLERLSLPRGTRRCGF
jgi:hypothetical protein